jgi:hypothetical protein
MSLLIIGLIIVAVLTYIISLEKDVQSSIQDKKNETVV